MSTRRPLPSPPTVDGGNGRRIADRGRREWAADRPLQTSDFRPRTSDWPFSAARWLFAILLAIYLITGGGHGYSIDGAFGYEMAKTVFLDPGHEYFHRFKTAFARWGALLPLLGQPLVLAGDALSHGAPERDALAAHGHRFRVEEWPAIGQGGQTTYQAPLPTDLEGPATSLALISFLANARDVPQGATVGYVRVWDAEQSVDLPLRAGVDTAEWAFDRPDVKGRVRHARAEVAGHWIGQPRGNLYVADLVLPRPMSVTRWELLAPATAGPVGSQDPGHGTQDSGLSSVSTGLTGDATWNVRAAAFRDAGGGWHDAFTGQRYWSPRQTRDFFTHFIYSTLNAFTTAAAAALVYLIGRQFGYRTAVATIGALGFGLATMAWPYAKLDFSEPASTAFVLLAVWALYKAFSPNSEVRSPMSGSQRRLRTSDWLGLLASLALLLAVIGKYTAALAAGLVVAQWILSSRPWQRARRNAALAFGAALVLPALALGLAAALVAFRLTGERPVVLTPGTIFERLGADWLALPFWTGFRGLIFSPGKSLFLYSPWLLLALPGLVAFARRHGWRGALVAGFPLVMVALYSKKLVWHGGSWGPRYMLPIVPFLCLAALPSIEWALAPVRLRWTGPLLAGLFAVSAAVQLVAIGKDPEQYPAMVREFVVPNLPEYGSALGGRDYWQARGGAGLARALQDPVRDSTVRGLGYLWGYPTAEMAITTREPRRFDLSLYFVDWDRRARREVVAIEDAGGRRSFALDRDFGDGLWATWQVQASPGAPVRITLAQTGPDTAVLSALAFGPPRTPRQDRPALDERTRGTWRGIYGADGYVLVAWRSFNVDVAALPPYVQGYDVQHVGDKPDARIHVEIAEQDLRDTPLLYALPFSPLLGNTWLLAADLVHLVFPGRPGLVAGILARPPWTWFGVQAPSPPHPEYGLGIDFWPALLYTNYASHRGVLATMWLVLLGLESALLACAAHLALRWWSRPVAVATVVTIGLAAAAFDWLQVQS